MLLEKTSAASFVWCQVMHSSCWSISNWPFEYIGYHYEHYRVLVRDECTVLVFECSLLYRNCTVNYSRLASHRLACAHMCPQMMKLAWDSYVRYSWGANELRPLSRIGHNAGTELYSTLLFTAILNASYHIRGLQTGRLLSGRHIRSYFLVYKDWTGLIFCSCFRLWVNFNVLMCFEWFSSSVSLFYEPSPSRLGYILIKIL